MDSQHQIAHIFLRNEEKLACEIQTNAGIADTMPSLISQSERAKNTIHCFGEVNLFILLIFICSYQERLREIFGQRPNRINIWTDLKVGL